jgi:hypothetical protein
MKTNQTASDSLHPPVIAGASTGGESRGLFDRMKITFQAESQTEIYINGNAGITIRQNGESHDDMICIYSKERAILIANAILDMAESATFEIEEDVE